MTQQQKIITFEKQKNIKAFSFTTIICSLIFILFVFAKWSVPVMPIPIADEGIEVNLGNSDMGLGDVEPQAPGLPSKEVATNPSASSNETPENNTNQEDVNDPEASNTSTTTPKIIKPAIAKNTTIPTKSTTQAIVKPNNPKAIFGGGTTKNTGGNKSESYNNSKNQGIAGGIGNQGNPNGNPNSDSYKGNSNSGNNGVVIKSGLKGRGISKQPNFEDEFNENAKVAVDITIDASGKVLSAIVNARGTTTTTQGIRKIATNKAMQLKFTSGNEEQSGTIVFNFKITN